MESPDDFEEVSNVPAWLLLERATACRKRLLAAGYLPLPVNGKAPPIAGWQDIAATDRIIDTWPTKYADATNTGILTALTPTVDIDIMFLEAADAIEALAREHFEERGTVMVRVGKPPKRAILLRTNADEAFKKLVRYFIAPNGSEHKIEILASGQQVVVFGKHPETQLDYHWHGGSPGEIKHEDLAYVREADGIAFLDAATELLIKEFGFKIKDNNKQQFKTNGSGHPQGEQAQANKPTSRERAYAQAALDGCVEEPELLPP